MGKLLIERIKYWSQLFLVPIYGLSFLFPRNKKIWLFGSTFGNRFAENPRYFYLYLSQHKAEEITAVWISRKKEIVRLLSEKGYRAYLKNSIKGFWYCLRGGVYLYDNYPKDISHFLSGGAVKINLWHGLPLKKIQMDNKHDYIRHPRNWKEQVGAIPRRLSDEKPGHFVLTTSRFYEPIFASAFGTSHVIISGYPRCDIFMTDDIKNVLTPIEKRSLEIIRQCRKKKNKIILYMPTFRDSEIEFFETVKLEELEEFLREKNYFFCVKLHCKSKLKKRFMEIKSAHIHIIPSEADPYCYIKNSDLLVTDYSSIYFDYILSGKPIIFFDYDYEEYISKSRELYFDYDEFTPGKKVQSLEGLKRGIEAALVGEEEEQYRRMREEIKQKAFDSAEAGCSEELYQSIEESVI